jgi:outer membrane protein OmpA-like peptidoglycan-associated protein
VVQSSAQELRKISYVQRSDIRRTVNKQYAGMYFGYHRASWLLTAPDTLGNSTVEAWYYLSQESNTDLQKSAKPLAMEEKVVFKLGADGRVIVKLGEKVPAGKVDLPLMRDYPSPPPMDILPGKTWRTTAFLAIDPRSSGHYTRLPLYIEYTFVGPAKYGERDVLQANARFALRYVKGKHEPGDPDLERAEGSRAVTIYYDPQTRFPVFMRERVENQLWRYSDGQEIIDNGFILTFWEGGLTYADREEIQRERQRDFDDLSPLIEKNRDQDITLRDDERGLALTLQNLRFVADKAELLPGEANRLDAVAEMLRRVPAHKQFVVFGHTAAIGAVRDQDILSEQRAKMIVDALVKRGIGAERLSWQGKGSREPVADNTTEAGRAMNRRVEILIVE